MTFFFPAFFLICHPTGALPVKRQVLAINPRALFRSDGEGKNRAFNFGARGLDRLACFLCQSTGEFLLAFGNRLCHTAEYPLPLECWKPARRSECFYCRLDCRFGVLAASLKNIRDHIAIVRRLDLDDIAFFNPLTI